MEAITAFCLVLVSLTIGDIVSAKTKAFVPSVFVSAIIFIVGFWTFFPENIVDLAALGTPLAQLGIKCEPYFKPPSGGFFITISVVCFIVIN